MEAALQVLEPDEVTLAELAVTANTEHRCAEQAGVTMLDHAIRAGEALLAARERSPAGEWSNWVADNIDAALVTVQLYMRLARYRDVIETLPDPPTSIKRAKFLLIGLPTTTPDNGQEIPAGPANEARRLRDEGLTYKAIGELFGVSYQTIRRWIDPDVLMRSKESSRRSSKKRHEAAKALRQKELAEAAKKAARKAGADAADAYAMAERLQDVLGRAHRNTDDREAREAWARAGEHYRKMRDEIVRALGVVDRPRTGRPRASQTAHQTAQHHRESTA